MEEIPKNYSDVYSEDLPPPVPATRSSRPGSTKGLRRNLDGESQCRRRRELGGGIDLNELLPRLDTLSRERQNAYADSTLRQHYNDVFSRRGAAGHQNHQAPSRPRYKVGIEYVEQSGRQRDRYLVKVERNTLEDVKAKLPIKGNYRLFFSDATGNECEEIEDDEAPVPFQRRNNEFYIHCRVFKK
jgi:hypothetical protein